MRADGRTVPEIALALGVSRSSVSVWVRDVALSAEQQATIRAASAAAEGRSRSNAARSAKARPARSTAQEQGRALARQGNALHQAGCMLFWAEGSRKRNEVHFTNADVEMHRYFLRFLRECYGVPHGRVRLAVNCFLGNGLELAEIEAWWLDRLALPRSSLRAATVNRVPSSSKRSRRTLLYGTARISVNSTPIVQSIYGAIQEYTGVERPEWLDLGAAVPAQAA